MLNSCHHTLSFKEITTLILVDMVNSYELWLNDLPTKGGLLIIFISHEPINVIKIDYNYHFNIKFGSYVHTHE